jgi:hypothetical protein
MTYISSKPIKWEKNGDTFIGTHPHLGDGLIYWVAKEGDGKWCAQWGRDNSDNLIDVARDASDPLISAIWARAACQQNADRAVREMLPDDVCLASTEDQHND